MLVKKNQKKTWVCEILSRKNEATISYIHLGYDEVYIFFEDLIPNDSCVSTNVKMYILCVLLYYRINILLLFFSETLIMNKSVGF